MKEERQKQEKKWLEVVITTVLAIVGIAILAVVLWKLSGAGDEPAKKEVFQIGEEMVYLDEVNLCILQNVMNLGITETSLNTTAEDGSSADDYYKQEILQMIMDYKVEAKVATQQGITLTNEEEEAVNDDVLTYISQIDGRILKELGITRDRIFEIFKERCLARKLENTVTEEVTVEEENYCTMYMLLFPKVEMEENGDYVRQEDGETPVMLSEEEIAEKKAEAEEAYQKLLDGADVEKIAKKYGVESVSGKESNLSGSFGEPFGEYAKTLKDGEYSPVIETESCYAILKMITANNEQIAKQILQHYREDLEEEAIEKSKTEWYEAAGVSDEAEWMGSTWESVSLYDFVQYVEE